MKHARRPFYAASTLETVFTTEDETLAQETLKTAAAFAAPAKHEDQEPVETQNREVEEDEEETKMQDRNLSENEGEIDKIERDDHDNSAGLETLVREFNSWVASVDFPVQKIEASLVGKGMRLGAVATEVIVEGQPYLSVPESIVLDATKVRMAKATSR